MIDARTAKRESILNSEALDYMNIIELFINKAIEEGAMSATISHSIGEVRNNIESTAPLVTAIKDKLVELGYSVEFKYADPLPSGCPTDQWNFNNGYIKVTWE